MLSSLTLFFLVLLCGGAPAHPLGVVPEFRTGFCAGGPELQLVSSEYSPLSDCLSQEYHNHRVTTFNHNVEQLGKRTADLSESWSESFFFFAGARWHTRGL